MTQNPSKAIVLSGDAEKTTSAKAKRFAQMAGAAALSLGMVGTFSIPAYAAAPQVEGQPDAVASLQQTLETADAAESIVPLTAPEGAVGAEVLEQERKEKEAKEAAAAAAKAASNAQRDSKAPAASNSDYTGKDVPAGKGASGLVNAALAQVGVSQDCTDLVQNSLAAIGLATRRDQGGYDHGVTDFMQYGTQVTDGNYAPGDILIWAGAPHVAIYIGNGQAVHGGWGGNQTVVNTYASPSATPTVIRLK